MGDVKEWDLFPTKIFESKFVANDEILNFINNNNIKNFNNSLVVQSENNNLQNMDVFSSFVKQIYSVTKKMCETYAYDYKKIDITSMWINVSEPNASHPPHTHSNNVFSGVWYPCENINTSRIHFIDPRPQANQLTPKRKKPNMNNGGVLRFNSNKDTMYMFPAWLMHWVPPTPNKRISISFNVILRGEYGEENTLQNANI
tara:strand:+ start:234 stop:836 length:603 start_codon:yes stop_codon:yes gene_type:complete